MRCAYCGHELTDETEVAGHDGLGHPVCTDCADGDEPAEAGEGTDAP